MKLTGVSISGVVVLDILKKGRLKVELVECRVKNQRTEDQIFRSNGYVHKAAGCRHMDRRKLCMMRCVVRRFIILKSLTAHPTLRAMQRREVEVRTFPQQWKF